MPRLEPSTTTITKVILASAAKCAFPGCNQSLIENEQLIGQLCHIEAASPGGQRYNSAQSDDKRRSYDNLILLCANHHKVTDDVNVYTVQKLKQMKRNHEAKMETEPTIDLAELSKVVSNLSSESQNEFTYTFTSNFVPYKEFEFTSDIQAVESKLRGQLQNVRRVAGHSSATEHAERIFNTELTRMKAPLTHRKANSDKMYDLELRKIQDFYQQLEEREMGKLKERGMGFSGQVGVIKEKIKKYSSLAIEELNILYGRV